MAQGIECLTSALTALLDSAADPDLLVLPKAESAAVVAVDLTGACNSEHVNGHEFSGAGGQLDFVRGAYASGGGKSVIALASTTRGGAISEIVPRLSGPVTTPRNETQYVVTEYGLVKLKALSSTERVAALIELAHPDYRGWLTDNAQHMHLI